MQKFTKIEASAIPMPIANIDTDMIIPKQFLKTIKRTGLGVNLFYEMRYDKDGNEIADFALNKPQYKKAQIIVAGENFGCGSSREHAPWAIADYGISCIIAPSFADIFYNNCFKNGILPIALSKDEVNLLLEDAKKGANAKLTVDLVEQSITRPDGSKIKFTIEANRKETLLQGLDDIGVTMKHISDIDKFEENYKQQVPWVFLKHSQINQ